MKSTLWLSAAITSTAILLIGLAFSACQFVLALLLGQTAPFSLFGVATASLAVPATGLVALFACLRWGRAGEPSHVAAVPGNEYAVASRPEAYLRKGDRTIHSVETWLDLARPRPVDAPWVGMDGTMALAKAWFPDPGRPHMPAELRALLDSRDTTRRMIIETGEPGRIIHFDSFGGEGRHMDLILAGQNHNGRILVGIDALANGRLGPAAGDYVDKALLANPQSQIPDRFALLCRSLLRKGPDDEFARSLRYPLLTGIAATLVDARDCGAETVVFVVHEFRQGVDPETTSANATDLDGLVRAFSGYPDISLADGKLLGPFHVLTGEPLGCEGNLFIGKCHRGK